MKSKNPAVWFEIYVDDLERAKKFYEQVLEVKLQELATPGDGEQEMQMLAFPMEMEEDGASGALVKMDGFDVGKNSTIIYFRSEDCAIEEKKIPEAGGKIFKSKMSIGEYGFIVLGYDTEGNLIGIHSQA